MKRFIWGMTKFVVLPFAGLVAVCWALDTLSDDGLRDGVVIRKAWTPSRVDTGTGVGPKGQVVVTSHYVPERFTVVIKRGDRTKSFWVTQESFDRIKEGDWFNADID